MKRKLLFLLIVLSVALNVAFIAAWALHAMPSVMHHWRGEPHNGVGRPLYSQLDVTEEQWREIKPHLTKFQESVREVSIELKTLRGEMIDLIAAPEPDREAIHAKQEEIAECRRRIQELVTEHLLAKKQYLRPEQQKQFFRMMRDRAGCSSRGFNPPIKQGRPRHMNDKMQRRWCD